MIEDSDDRKDAADLSALKSEMTHARTAEGARKAAEELLFKSVAIGSAEPDPILAKVIKELECNPGQYYCLLDVWEGNVRGAGQMVIDHMVELGKIGKNWTMHKAMAHLDSLAFKSMQR